jgi:hypothetical protein
MRNCFRLLALLLLCTAAIAAADDFTVTDTQGKTHKLSA